MTVQFSLTQGESPLILSMPHPGTALPEEIYADLTERGRLVEDTDWHMRALYSPIEQRFRPSVLEAKLSRFVIDLNRDPSGASLYPGQATTELVPMTTFDGTPIWKVPPDSGEIARRRALYFQPYHDALAAEIAWVKAHHGFCLLWDCHSIKSRIPRLFEGVLPMLNLGTNGGGSCAPGIQYEAERVMAETGFTQVSNGRFKGGWITRNYGRPTDGVHAIQMELALSGYLAAEAPPWTFAPDIAQSLQRALEMIVAASLASAEQLS